jgi:hypothetical protein
VGTKKAVAIAVKNHKIQLRYTGLARRLQRAGREPGSVLALPDSLPGLNAVGKGER